MNYLAIRLCAQSPLSVRSDHAARGVQTTQYIPGTTLLGSLASTYKRFYPDNHEQFERLFLSGEVSFPYLYPASPKDYHADNQESINLDLPVYSAPKTAITCKRQKGFLYPKIRENDAHGVRDTLIAWAFFQEWVSDDQAKKDPAKMVPALQVLEETRKCHKEIGQSHCGEPTDRYEAYYRCLENGHLYVSEIKTNRHTHTGISRLSGTIEEGILYDRQVAETGTEFWGLVKLADEKLQADLEAFLNEVNNAQVGRIGTGRTRGMGKVSFLAEDANDLQPDFQSFQKRLDAFDRLLHKEAARFQLAHFKPYYYFALTLHSPAIVQDELLRYRGAIDETVLTELLTVELDGLKLVYQQAGMQRITGWQELWGLPKFNEYAIEAGSVFLFKCSVAQRDTLVKELYRLEKEGIGKRRLEGFGRFCVSDEFHQEIDWI